MTRQEEVLVALRRIIRAVDRQSRRLMQETGLTGPQLLVLQVLRRDGALCAGALAAAVHLSQPTITAIVDRLEAKRLLRRYRDSEDKRKVLIDLTALGRRTAARAPEVLQRGFVESFQAMADWEQTLIVSSLQRVAGMLDATEAEVEDETLLEPRSLETSAAI